MVSLIRDEPHKGRNPKPASLFVWCAVLSLLAVSSGWLGYKFYNSLGLPAGLLFGGIAGASAIAAFLSLFRADVTASERSRLSTSAMEEVFAISAVPSLLVRKGQPNLANKAYANLAKDLGVETVGISPPAIDSLFDASSQSGSSAIFRLHHLGAEEENAAETIDRLSLDGQLRRFKVQVSRVGQGFLWQIHDQTLGGVDGQGILSDVPIGLCVIGQNGRIMSMNESLKQWVGEPRIGLPRDRMPEFFRELVTNPEALLDSPKTEGRVVRADMKLATQKGVTTPTVMMAVWREVGEQQFVAHVAFHGHSSLNTSKARRASPSIGSDAGYSIGDFSASPIAILELDGTALRSASIRRVNSAFETMTGQSDWEEKLFSDIFKSGQTGLEFLDLNAAMCSPDTPYDAVLVGKQSLAVSTYIVMDKVTEICRVFLVDISMRKSLEDQLVQSQKMQAIGRLVAEIAHDFNNLLAAMRLYTDTLLGRHPVGDPSYPELQQINANVNRAAELVKKLLAYSRKQTIRAVKLDVSETLSDIAVTLKQVLGERVNLETVYGRDLPPVKVDKNQLETVLMNLAVNARDAMKEQGGGKITIKSEGLKRRDIEGTALRAALTGLKGDEFVQVSVADTGTGITDEIKSKIFEPFFTTKAQGEGTGLGLSTVYGIVQQSGGHLAVESELGVGTTFTVYLPAYDGPDDADAAHAQSQSRKPRPPSNLAGQGNILFVEDEDSVRVIAAKTLRKRGYNVIEACDGEEAYEILQDGEESFDLMISDVVMPGMDGPTLLKKARTELGDARIVFISGYAEEEFSELLSEEPDVTFLPKPFSLVELAEKVKAEIGAG